MDLKNKRVGPITMNRFGFFVEFNINKVVLPYASTRCKRKSKI